MKTVDALTSGIHCHLTGAQNISAEGLHGIQSLNLYQAGQEVWDAVTRCAHSLEELQAVTHTTDLVTLQAEALGQVPPCLHYSCLTAVGGAQHAAGLFQAVKGELCGAQSWSKKELVKQSITSKFK